DERVEGGRWMGEMEFGRDLGVGSIVGCGDFQMLGFGVDFLIDQPKAVSGSTSYGILVPHELEVSLSMQAAGGCAIEELAINGKLERCAVLQARRGRSDFDFQ